jgi:magnesium transporter
MAQGSVQKRSRKSGLPPGTPVLVGRARSDRTRITILDYDEQGVQEKEAGGVEECIPFKDKKSVTWINVDGLSDIKTLEKLGEAFGLHPLIIEDILNTEQRPKTEEFADYIYIVIKMLYMDESGLGAEQISIILGRNFVISFQEREGDVLNPLRERIRSDKGRIRKLGPDYLAYSILDAVVDNYFVILERFGESIETMEEELIATPTPRTLRQLHKLKRDMILLRKSVWPLREVLGIMVRSETSNGSLVKKPTIIYLRDVYDHTIQIIDAVETYRDMLSGMIDIYLSSISNRLNEIMKVLTIIGTIFIPLTFVTGLYGMNFRYMPELDSPLGYPAVLALMLAMSAVMLAYFKRKRWI